MENFLFYVVLCILLIILPGPDTAIVTKNTLVTSRRAGFETMFGTLTALMIHTTFAIIGLSAIIVQSAKLFTVIKFVGAIYLIYLGVKTFIAMAKRKAPTAIEGTSQSKSSFYFQGFFTNLLNPKVAVFFLTFLPQFVANPNEPLLPFLILGITYTVLTLIWFIFYITLLSQVRAFMNKPTTQKWMEGITGAVLVGFGIQLAAGK